MTKLATITLSLLATSLFTHAAPADLQKIELKNIEGKETSLKDYDGKVVLVVNVASKCGLTPQYSALESLYQKYKDKGFTVIAFPCNDFGGQEPGTLEEIKAFCSTKYQVTFPMMDKLHVKGDKQHPLYAALTGKDSAFPGKVKWNFGKFLIGKDGKLIARFGPRTKPDDAKVTAAIAKALK